MNTPKIEDEVSDDEIHFGKITIKEIKKILCTRKGPSTTYDVSCKNDLNTSLRLIETHSQPNLRPKPASPVFSSNPGSPNCDRQSDDSFIQMENMVSKLCMSPRNSDNMDLNNTLEVIDYILNHGPNKEPVKKQNTEEVIHSVSVKSEHHSPLITSPEKKPSKTTLVKETPMIPKDTDYKDSPTNYYTPAKSVMKKPLNVITTPSSSSIKSKTPVFKTPANPTLKKPCTPRLTPGRSNAYQHITSPIASYIKNCPQAPLVKDVHPKKPLPGASSIPKFIRNLSQDKTPMVKNKENINLPSIAYKSAKKTKVIQLPDENKLPQSQWVKKITSFPKPTVMKHENREVNLVKKLLLSNQDDSFNNLSCHQAEVSVCTQKTAFKSTNKH